MTWNISLTGLKHVVRTQIEAMTLPDIPGRIETPQAWDQFSEDGSPVTPPAPIQLPDMPSPEVAQFAFAKSTVLTLIHELPEAINGVRVHAAGDEVSIFILEVEALVLTLGP
jgi:hypothetical protein